jgi:hypothetical protein
MSFASGGDILPHFFRNVNARDVSVALRESTPRPPILAIEAAPKPKGWISSKDLKKMHH